MGVLALFGKCSHGTGQKTLNASKTNAPKSSLRLLICGMMIYFKEGGGQLPLQSAVNTKQGVDVMLIWKQI